MRNGQVIAQRLRPHHSKLRPCTERLCRNKIKRTKPARIVQRQGMARFGFENDMVVLVRHRRIDPPAPTHAQMEHQGLITVGMDQAIFCTSSQRSDPRAGQCLHQIGGEGAA